MAVVALMKPSTAPRRSYDAFLSYSHTADNVLAPALQRGLHRLAKPWHRPRALRVFRDTASLAANPDLWTTIEGALKTSRYFILLASRESAGSRWVGREISFWKTHRGPGTMLIALTDGEIVWDHEQADFDWSRTTALPDELRGWFHAEPLWVDLRWAAAKPALSLDDKKFREAVGTLAAAVHGVAKDELDSEEIQQHRRTIRALGAGVITLAVLLVVVLITASLAYVQQQEAEKQRRQAEEQRRLATARALQAEAENERDTHPVTSLRLSLASFRIKPTTQAREGLLSTLQRTHVAGASATRTGKSVLASYSATGTLLATSPLGGNTVDLWDTRDALRPQRLASLSGHREFIDSLTFSRDEHLLATISHVGMNPTGGVERGRSSLTLWDLTDRSRPRSVLNWTALHDVRSAAFSPDGKTMAVVAGGANGTLQLWDVTRPSTPRKLTRPLDSVDSDTVMFGPDGRTLVTGSGVLTASDDSLDPKSITHATGWTAWDVRDTRNPRAVARRRLFGSAVFSSATPILAVGYGRTLMLWDLRRPEQPRQLSRIDQREQVESSAFSPDGRFLAVALLDKTAFLLDVNDPARPGTPVALGQNDAFVHAIAFSGDGRTFSLADDSGAITRWQVDTRAPARIATLTMKLVRLTASAFSPDGRRLAIAAAGGKVQLWDTSDPDRPHRKALLTGHLQIAQAVSFNGDGSVLAVGSEAGDGGQDGKITLWDTTDVSKPRRLAQIPTKSGVSAIALSPRRPTLAAVGSFSFKPSWASLWDIRDPEHPVHTKLLDPYEPQAQTSTPGAPGRLPFLGTTPAVFAPDGTTLALPDSLWDVTNLSSPTRLPLRRDKDSAWILHEGYSTAAFSADGRDLVTSDGSDLSAWSVNPKDGRRLISTAEFSDRFSRIDLHPEGHLIATGSPNGRTRLLVLGGPTLPTLAATPTNVTPEVTDVRFSPDRKTLAVTLGSGKVELWNLGALPAIAADPTRVACGIIRTGLSREQWRQYAPGLPYEPTCP
ncbi:hypothetical protein AB0C21_42780 [Spirillospora sp. NPDC049024]